MNPELRDYLLSVGEVAQEEGVKLNSDMATYQQLAAEMPRIFPAPDEIYTKNSRMSDFDAVIAYVVNDGEEPEALRITLSLVFGLQEWEIEIDKCSDVSSLRALKFFGNYTVLIRIVGVRKQDYTYTIKNDSGTVLSGPVTCTKFVSLTSDRPDVSPEIFIDRMKSNSYRTYIHAKQAHICALAALGIPDNVPMPDEVVPALGMHFDIDFTYVTDTNGKLRRELDRTLGYSGWSAIISKLDGQFSLHTVVPIDCGEYTLKIRVNILDACARKERLILMKESPDKLAYRATQPCDPDHKDIIGSLGKPTV